MLIAYAIISIIAFIGSVVLGTPISEGSVYWLSIGLCLIAYRQGKK